MSYKLDDEASISENIVIGQKAITEAADAILDEVAPCALSLKKAWTKYEEELARWNAFATKMWHGYRWMGYDADPMWKYFEYSFSNNRGAYATFGTHWYDTLRTLAPWWAFTENLNVYSRDMSSYMAGMPDDETLIRMKAKKMTDEETNATFEQVVKANHGSVETYFAMASISEYSGYDKVYAAKMAGTLLPDPDLSEDYVNLGHIRGNLSAWHPYRWVNGNDHQDLTTAGETGGGGSTQLMELSVKYREHANAAANILRQTETGAQCRLQDPAASGDGGNWNTTDQAHWNDGHVYTGSKSNTQYYVADSNAQVISDELSSKYWHSDATSLANLYYTLWGQTFYRGSIRWPEFIFWWATPTHNYKNTYLFRTYIRGSVNAPAPGGTYVNVDTGAYCYYRPYYYTDDGGNQLYYSPKRTSPSEYGDFYDWNGDMYGGYQYGTLAGYSSGDTPMDHLQKRYFALKAALYELREAVGCILKLDVNLWEAERDLTEFVAAVQKDDALPDDVQEAAQAALDKMEANEGDITRATSTFTKNLIFREQCYLLAQVKRFAEYKKKRDRQEDNHQGTTKYKRSPYQGQDGASKNTSLIIHADTPYGFINKLTQPPSQAVLFNMENWDISTLQPQIRLYKIVFDKESRKEKEVEIEFDAFANTSKKVIRAPGSRDQTTATILSDKNKRGFGVGVQSFNFTYDGSNPFAAKKSIKGELKIFANTFDELLEYRGSKPDMYRYVDLALKTSNNNKKDQCYGFGRGFENEELAKLNFRLKAVVGWAFPEGAKMDHLSPGVKDAIYDSFVTLNLTPTVHDFGLDEQGRVTFSIKYLAYADDFFDQKEYDIFNNVDIIESQILRRLTYKNNNRTCNITANEEMKDRDKETIGEEKRQSVSTLMNDMITKDKIYYVIAKTDAIRNFQAEGPFYDPPGDDPQLITSAANKEAETEKLIAEALDQYEGSNPEVVRDQISVSLQATNPNSFDIPFFYVSDLVDVILEGIGDTLDKMPQKLDDQYASRYQEKSLLPSDESEAAAGGDRPQVNKPWQTKMPEKTYSYFGYDEAPILTVCKITLLQETGEEQVDFRMPNGTCGDENVGGYSEIHTVTNTTYSSQSTEAGSTTNFAEMNPYECDVALMAEKYLRLQKQFRKFRVILGPVEIIDRKNDIGTDVFTLADLPISVKYFVEFLTEKLASKEVSTYSLANFLNDFFNNLMRNFLNDDTCFTNAVDISQKVRMTSAAITSYREPRGLAGDDVIEQRIKVNSYDAASLAAFKSNDRTLYGRISPEEWKKFDMGFMNIAGQRGRPGGNLGFDNELHYMVYFAGRTSPKEKMTGNRLQDEAAGIFHYVLGRDKGIVKNISLSKTTTAGLQEVRFEQGGYDGLRQLRVIYDVNIDTYSNVKAFPGTYIFVDPQSFAPNTNLVPCDDLNLTEYGIGGYYMIIRSEHSFAPGDASTKIFAKWVNQLDGPGSTGLCGDPVGGRIQKCGKGDK
tara:strand:- start:2204 stop:6628 length:4425 start_codon:yes stop_codon:yes gene_type:complete